MRVVFAGTPEFAAAALAAILGAGFSVPLVLTQPDRAKGRGQKTQASAVKTLAVARGIPVHQSVKLRSDADREPIAAARPDVMIVAAYGLLLPQALLDLPALGALNIHASLLPRWRGAAPIQRAILAGDSETGISIMQMDAGLDTGPVISTYVVPIGPRDTAGMLHDRLIQVGADAIVAVLKTLEERGSIESQPQPGVGASYAPKITDADAVIDWKLPARSIDQQVRALNPVPGAITMFNQAPLKIWEAEALDGMQAPPGLVIAKGEHAVIACGSGALRLVTVQRPGGKRMPAAALMAGGHLKAGTVVGDASEA